MSWLQTLYETYETCARNSDYVTPPQADDGKETPALMPVSHTSQQAQIHIVLDADGNFQFAELLPPKTPIVLPATEESAGRTSGTTPHPLADKIHYCAKDYTGGKKNCYSMYAELLKKWCDSPYSHPKIKAVYAYISQGRVVRDLVQCGILHADEAGELLLQAPEGMQDSIFSRLVAKKVNGAQVRDQGDALVVWSVATADDEARTWKDASLQQAWIAFDASQKQERDLCMVRGEESSLAVKHPRKIRNSSDNAKLISSNDTLNYTFRGRFLEASEACTVGYEVSHKAHNALRWLIARQGYRNGEQTVLAWAVNGACVPNPCEDIPELTEESFMVDAPILPEPQAEDAPQLNIGKNFADRLSDVMGGYKADLSKSGGIAVIALEAASPGRLAVTFYREQIPEQYIERLELWQGHFAWSLPVYGKKEAAEGRDKNKKRTLFTTRAPVPDVIARVAYGRRMDDKLRKATVERLLPCIVDAASLPRDIMESCVRRACNRAGLENWEWPEVLGVACAVYKGYYARHHNKKEYSMALETDRRTRDYLYGRLLAAAEYLERTALDDAEKYRPTSAERLMQRFADQPFATWLQLEQNLHNSYIPRLRSNSSKRGFLRKGQEVMQEVHDLIEHADYTSNRRLSGEFLLGYHCQLQAFYTPNKKDNTANETAPEGE